MSNEEVLLISDLHFTSKPQDEYRWGLFDKLNELMLNRPLNDIYILGDLTDAKDNHSAALVNRLVDNLTSLAKSVKSVKILRGNHDGINVENPYFEFLKHIPNLEYIKAPLNWSTELFLPHSRNPEEDWKDIDFTNRIVYAHVSVDGAVYETGMVSSAPVSADIFKNAILAFSGDIHSPQTIGNLNYVGCPYRVRFNDRFMGGGIILNLDNHKWERIEFNFPHRWTVEVTSVRELETNINCEGMRAGDQIKVRLHLNQDNMSDWRQIKEDCRMLLVERGIELCAFEMIKDYQETIHLQADVNRQFTDFDGYCKKQQITPELVQVGKEIVTQCKS